jgi:hypothetical protein
MRRRREGTNWPRSLSVIPALGFLFGLFGYWTPGSGVVVVSLIFCFTVGEAIELYFSTPRERWRAPLP